VKDDIFLVCRPEEVRMVAKHATKGSIQGTPSPIRAIPTTNDLARSIQALDMTLSEVLVLLYHVVQANDELMEAVRAQRVVPPPMTLPALVHVRDRAAER
jgi:hypothetical protein